MKQLTLAILVSMLQTLNATGQQEMGERNLDIRLLTVGTSTRPIELSKRWFEWDTLYIISFRNSRASKTDKTGSQGFFKSELKEFGHALKTTLTIDSNHEVRFSNGTIILTKGDLGKRFIECTFASNTGSFRARVNDVQKLVEVIFKQ